MARTTRLALFGLVVLTLCTAMLQTGSRMLPTDPILVGAGDIADCNSPGDEATAKLLDRIPGAVMTIGDNAYDSGSDSQFAKCYDPSWGRYKTRTYPAVGNHEYGTAGAAGYFNYFGAAAGDRSKGYYSYDLGKWHIIVLNSNCEQVGGCQAGSPEEQWLRADLAAHPATCTLAYWHHPLFSSGATNGSDPRVRPFWQALYDYGADLVLNGHDHDYERFAPQDPTGAADSARGIREFVIGTGGKNLRSFGKILPNSEVHDNSTFGVLKLTLHPTSYDWEFVPATNGTFLDSGSASCVDIPSPSPTPVVTRVPISYQAEVLADKPVSYWRLGELSGTTAADSGTGGNSGVIVGGVTADTPGALANDSNPAMTFDGSTGYIGVANNANLNLTGDLTIEAWAKPGMLNGAGGAIIHKGGTGEYSVWQYRLSITSGNHWRGTVFIGGTSVAVTDPGVPSTSRWDHLVMTRNGSTLTLYVNGVSVATTTASGALNTSTGILAIGRSGDASSNYFNGSIDEVAIYNSALPASRTFAHYDAAVTAGAAR